ncbi:MAG TPA: PEGA domain-containing protein [Polyangiaceae bacterium]|nr:PEGA domain-containing protein [Polyangiaceae bacterium]
MPGRYAACAAVLVALGLHASQASADAAADREASRERFRLGAQAYSEGRFKDAIDLFRDADRLSENPAFSYNIGQAYEELGDAANALRWYRAYLRALPEAPDQAEVQPRVAAAERHLAERGVQQVTVLSSPEGATVSLDGRRVGVAPWTAELTPGTHQLGLELKGYADGSSTFELPKDHAIDVVVPLHRLPDPVTVTVTTQAASACADRGSESWVSRVGPVTWATLGVGVAGLGAALGLELSRSAAEDAARHAPTNLAGADEYHRATSLETASRVALAAGGAVTILGGVLFYLDVSKHSRSSEHVGAAFGCSGGGCTVGARGAF